MFISGCISNALFSDKNKLKVEYLSDSLYDNEAILNQLASILNDSLNNYRDRTLAVCRVEFGKPKSFFVYDLVDTLNNTIDNGKIAFIDKHIYHFSTISYAFSYSNICILDGSQIIIFRNVNCPQSSDSIADVLDYAKMMLKGNKNVEEILTRIKNYRKYSGFLKMDNFTSPPDGCE